jgi:prepilin-type N-terminal cleavage/methylation domain-containing protein
MSLRRLLRRVHREEGYSLIEMLTVMVIMGVVMSSLSTVFITASNSETDMNNRYQAQLTARLALDKMRREVHCAKVATPAGAGATSSVTLTLSWTQSDGTTFNCKTGSGSVTWCTRNVATNRYALYRVVGSTCTGGVKWGDFLVPSAGASTCGSPTALCIFAYTAQSTSSLAKLHVDIPVNVMPAKTFDRYELVDDIALRNSTRVGP